jgi:hypothetical protein
MYIYGKTKVDSVDNLVDIMFFPYRRKIFGKTDKAINGTKKYRFHGAFPVYQFMKIGDK